jgi:hypothetical protein
VATTEIAGLPTILFTFPPPQEATEVYFVAVILQTGPEDDLPRDVPPFYYFTLELGFQIDDNNPRTVLCSWEEDRHFNFGSGPQVDAEAFLCAVSEVLKSNLQQFY